MTTTARYCTSCGSPLAPGNRFCAHCGKPVQAPPTAPAPAPESAQAPPPPPSPAEVPPTPPPPPAAAEQMLGFVAVGKSKGMLGMRQDSYTMIVTPSRLVFAYVSPELMKATVSQAREEAKAQGKGLLGRWGAQLTWMDRLHQQYQTMTVDDILRQYPGSFTIANHQIRRVRYKQNWDDEGGQENDEIIFRTPDGKQRFKLLSGNLRQVKKLLRQTLGRAA